HWHHFSHSGLRIDVETGDDSIGGHFLHLLHGREPSKLWVRAMHTSLILYAEHEFNASTFTARVVAGTGSDMHSAITAAIGALKGPTHGGANAAAMRTFEEFGSPEAVPEGVRRYLDEKKTLFGFGHPVYVTTDIS